MKDLTIIIPVHECNEQVKTLLKKAIRSVDENISIQISCPKSLYDELKNVTERKNMIISTVDENSNTDFCTLVNDSVLKIKTKWFSILEFDDEYTDIWFKNVEKYIRYKPDVSVFLPLEEIIRFNEDNFIGYGNEAPWATSFSNEIGYIDNDCLQQYFDFYLTGSVFSTEDWINQGGLKPSIKISFWYEFLLRLTNNGKKIFVIPKLGYKHYVERENSLYEIYKKTIKEEESSWWFNLAKQESVYKKDRNKTYENSNEKGV